MCSVSEIGNSIYDVEQRSQSLFDEQQFNVFKQTDKLFAWLLVGEWLVGIVLALTVSPRTWAGRFSDTHIHVWVATFLGAAIIALPIYLAITKPGQKVTRHVIAIGQMLWSALLIHLSGGRIESHFHVFGSLAFLSFYRDWRVLISASAVVAIDHILGGLLLPRSVYGVNFLEPWRWLEHVWWVLFEDTFLICGIRRSVQEMKLLTRKQAQVEEINAKVEKTVVLRTKLLNKATRRLDVQYSVAKELAGAESTESALSKAMVLVSDYFAAGQTVNCAFWQPSADGALLQCTKYTQRPDKEIDTDFAKYCRQAKNSNSNTLPATAWSERKAQHLDLREGSQNALKHSVPGKSCSTAFAFPIIELEHGLGVLEFWCAAVIEDDADFWGLLTVLGQQLGQFMARQEEEKERARLANVVQSSYDAVIIRSRDNLITSWNRGAEKIFGYSAGEVKLRPHSILLPAGKHDEMNELDRLTAKGEIVDGYETQRRRKDGKVIDVLLSMVPIVDGSENTGGYSVTMKDITERKEAERRVSEFYSIVSHELRTPLTSIRGALGLIQGGIVKLDSPESRELIQVAQGSSDRLIRLINDMLDLKKIESGKMELKLEKIVVDDLVCDTVHSLAGMAKEAAVQLCLDVRLPDAAIMADWDKTTQILTNLLSNAIKFSPAERSVTVTVEVGKIDKMVRFSVQDHGPGIAESDLQRVFEKFQQVDSSDTRQNGGTGLGLAITKALVEQHGGSIGIDSTVGVGSTFWFEIPRYAKPQDENPVAEPVFDAAEILLLEEDDGISNTLRTFLERQGYKVRAAATVGETKVFLEDWLPDLVIIDLLDDGSTVEFIDSLRNRSSKDIPLIAMSGCQKGSEIVGNAATMEWLTEPLDMQQLASAVKRALRRSVSGFTVLIADDDYDTRRVLAAQLKSMGLVCLEARDGAEAISLARTDSPDLIVLDVVMPVMDGFQVVDVLRNEQSRTTPLLIYSGADLSAQERGSLKLGVTRHLTKGDNSKDSLQDLICELLSDLAPEKLEPGEDLRFGFQKTDASRLTASNA